MLACAANLYSRLYFSPLVQLVAGFCARGFALSFPRDPRGVEGEKFSLLALGFDLIEPPKSVSMHSMHSIDDDDNIPIDGVREQAGASESRA